MACLSEIDVGSILPPMIRGHSRILAHSMQCAGWRGIDASVHIGTAALGVSISSEHS